VRTEAEEGEENHPRESILKVGPISTMTCQTIAQGVPKTMPQRRVGVHPKGNSRRRQTTERNFLVERLGSLRILQGRGGAEIQKSRNFFRDPEENRVQKHPLGRPLKKKAPREIGKKSKLPGFASASSEREGIRQKTSPADRKGWRRRVATARAGRTGPGKQGGSGVKRKTWEEDQRTKGLAQHTRVLQVQRTVKPNQKEEMTTLHSGSKTTKKKAKVD